jgi:hypothetical protein
MAMIFYTKHFHVIFRLATGNSFSAVASGRCVECLSATISATTTTLSFVLRATECFFNIRASNDLPNVSYENEVISSQNGTLLVRARLKRRDSEKRPAVGAYFDVAFNTREPIA